MQTGANSLKTAWTNFKEFVNLLGSGMSGSEVGRMVGTDTRTMYAYYARSVKETPDGTNKVVRWLRLAWYVFVAFLGKLTPARRLFYVVALVFFAMALWYGELINAVYAFLVVNFILALEVAEKLMAKDELEVARQIQLRLLPDSIDVVPGFSASAQSDVATSVGGDYYDVLRLADGSTLVVIADVSGKGMSAALYAVKVQTALQLLAQEHADVRELLCRLNEHVASHLRRSYFLTIGVARLFPDGTAQYCRAGHMPALLYRSATRTCEVLKPAGTAIGFAGANSGNGNGHAENGFGESLEVETRKLEPGDSMLLYTDGLVEAADAKKEEFGEQRLKELLAREGWRSTAESRQLISSTLTSFRGPEPLRDDTTFVIVKRNG